MGKKIDVFVGMPVISDVKNLFETFLRNIQVPETEVAIVDTPSVADVIVSDNVFIWNFFRPDKCCVVLYSFWTFHCPVLPKNCKHFHYLKMLEGMTELLRQISMEKIS